MKYHLNVLWGVALCVLLAAGCGGRKNRPIGGERDDHGCLSAAGYTWSEVRHDCIRIFETGVQLVDSRNPDATLAAYAVFSADGAKTELFLPAGEKHPIMTRRDGDCWRDGRYELSREAGKLCLSEKGERIFHEK